MRLSMLLSVLALCSSVSFVHAQQATTAEEGITRETITRFSEEEGVFIPLHVEAFGRLRAETLGASVQEHCVGQAGLKAIEYQKKGAQLEVIEKSERSAFYVATLGRTSSLRERVILIYCDGVGTLMVGLKVDPEFAGQMKPTEQYVKETTNSSTSSTTGSTDKQPPVTININNGNSGN